MQVVDALLLQYTVEKTLERVGSANLLFAFDYIILASISVSVFVKCAPQPACWPACTFGLQTARALTLDSSGMCQA